MLPQVIGASKGDKLAVVKEMGATTTIDYTQESIKDKVGQLRNRTTVTIECLFEAIRACKPACS